MIDNTNARRGTRKGDLVSSFEAIKIKLASPETIKGWSKGEVKNPETINYRSLKPEKDGLFCERIFGPTRDFECSCGKYKRIKREDDFRCDRCGVQVTESKVRRENMGHIELAVPVSHVWFFKHIALMLNMSAKNLEQILYYEAYVVTDPGDTPLLEGQVLSEEDYMQQRNDYGDAFIAEMGAGAIKTLLERINLQMLQGELIKSLEDTNNKALKKKSMKRLRLVEGFINGNSRPEYMLLSILPVLPPDLRPLVPLDGGRYATSDLNDLYRRVINRNNRLKSLIQIRTPEVIIRNEKRMLQEAVDALMDNGRHGRAVTTMSSRALKSLSDMLTGKQGRFRQNLLGKRVDYSGRSVIVVGPELRINQCGLPKRMAMVLFEPFIIRHLKEEDGTRTVKAAKAMIEAGDPKIWDILEKVIKGHPIMLNRAPTLHRLSIQAFDPVLIEGSAIRLHPMVCTAYNADFDGDQMAVHVPLSNEAQMEAKLLMLSPNNIFSPANGKPIASPTHDITLGAYYLTCDPINKDKAKLYRDYFEAIVAKDDGYITMHDAIRIPNPDYGKDTRHGDKNSKYILTTVGRCLFNEIWDKRLGFYNKLAKKKDLQALISESYQISGHAATIKLLDDLKDLGYKHSTLAGLSISIADMKVPEEKDEIIKSTTKEIETVMGYFDAGALTDGERHKRVIDLWSQANDKVTGALLDRMEGERKHGIINPLYAMLDSGARGSKDQVRQLAGMRGLMAKPNGDIIERPIISNFREGLSVLEYFISTHGARKGLADTALKTADSGYMTRKLVDVAQDVICREEDCGTTSGIDVEALRDGDDILLPLRDRIFGRFCAYDVRDPAFNDGRLIIGAGEEFTKEICDLIDKRGISRVKIRSALTCETVRGICVKCYGRNLANDRLAKIGDALGIIAAQSIGEPGTQLTMRTFHIGGTASVSAQSTEMKAKFNGVIRLMDVRTVERKKDDGTLETIVINGGGKIIIYDAEKAKALEKEKRDKVRGEVNVTGGAPHEDYDYFKDAIEESKLDEHDIEPGSVLLKKDGDTVEKGDTYIKREADNIPIIADMEGIVELVGLIENVTLKKTQKANSESDQGVVTYNNTDSSTQPKIVIHGLNEKNLASDGKNTPTSEFPLQPGTVLMVKNGEKVFPGTTIAREPRESAKNRDITGGLPRISELFDARNPKVAAIISTIDGVVKEIEVHGKDNNSTNRRIVTIEDSDSKKKAVLTVPGKLRLLVRENDSVRKGQKLTEGSVVLSQLLAARGAVELQNTLVREIQKVYRSQGVEINDKHIEIIIRQMMQKVTIINPGDSDFMSGEVVDRSVFDRSKRSLLAQGKNPAKSEPMLLGITQASLKTDSFISAAAFQNTTDILTDAAVESKTDNLLGFKESVITGHLIPAGTGTLRMQSIKLKYLGEEIPDETIIDAETEHNVDDDIKDLFGDEIPEEANEFIVDPGELDDSFLEE